MKVEFFYAFEDKKTKGCRYTVELANDEDAVKVIEMVRSVPIFKEDVSAMETVMAASARYGFEAYEDVVPEGSIGFYCIADEEYVFPKRGNDAIFCARVDVRRFIAQMLVELIEIEKITISDFVNKQEWRYSEIVPQEGLEIYQSGIFRDQMKNVSEVYFRGNLTFFQGGEKKTYEGGEFCIRPGSLANRRARQYNIKAFPAIALKDEHREIYFQPSEIDFGGPRGEMFLGTFKAGKVIRTGKFLAGSVGVKCSDVMEEWVPYQIIDVCADISVPILEKPSGEAVYAILQFTDIEASLANRKWVHFSFYVTDVNFFKEVCLPLSKIIAGSELESSKLREEIYFAEKQQKVYREYAEWDEKEEFEWEIKADADLAMLLFEWKIDGKNFKYKAYSPKAILIGIDKREEDAFGELWYHTAEFDFISYLAKKTDCCGFEVQYRDENGETVRKALPNYFENIEGEDWKEFCVFGVKRWIERNLEFFRQCEKDIREELEKEKQGTSLYSVKTLQKMEEIRAVLYDDAKMIPDVSVVQGIFEIVQQMEKAKDGKIPNLVFMGPPGCGKTTLAKRSAMYFVKNLGNQEQAENHFLEKSASDLKGAHVGQTAVRVFDMLKEASKNQCILFIDEAYSLQNDDFGKEAVDILLPVMSGDRDVIEKQVKKDKELVTEKFSFSKDGKGVPPIWFGGYEHEMRKMLSKNPGLYRRMMPISLTPPSVKGLFDYLCGLSERNERCLSVIQDCESEIKQYFAWGMHPEYVGFFANFAGVEKLYRTIDIYMDDSVLESQKKPLIYRIIDEKRTEIKKQYDAIVTDIKKAEFKVETDIDVTLEDVVGNEKAVDELRNIVRCLYVSATNEQFGFDAPKGALLVGGSGFGKTFMVRAMAGEIQKQFATNFEKNIERDYKIAFIETLASELREQGKIESLFQMAEEYDVCIVFIDNLEEIGMRKELPESTGGLVSKLIKEMSRHITGKNVFVAAATENKELLDTTLFSSGKFEYVFELGLPDMGERQEIFRKHIERLPIWQGLIPNEAVTAGGQVYAHPGNKVEEMIGRIARKSAFLTMGCTPVEMKNSIERAAMQSLDAIGPVKSSNCWISSFDKILNDILERYSSIWEKKLDSFSVEQNCYAGRNVSFIKQTVHQVGHFFAKYRLKQIKDIDKKIDMLYKLGDEKEDLWLKTASYTPKELLENIYICLGGRILEELFFKSDLSEDALRDEELALEYAQRYLFLYGTWRGKKTARGIVDELIYLTGRGLHKRKRDFLNCIKKLYELERADAKILDFELISYRPEKVDISEEKMEKEGAEKLEIERILVVEDDANRGQEIQCALQTCVTGAVEVVNYENLSEKTLLSDNSMPYEFVVYDAREEESMRAWKSSLSGGKTMYIRYGGLGDCADSYLNQPTSGYFWYIKDRDMVADMKNVMMRMKEWEKEQQKHLKNLNNKADKLNISLSEMKLRQPPSEEKYWEE